jgi:hypothetical protein
LPLDATLDITFKGTVYNVARVAGMTCRFSLYSNDIFLSAAFEAEDDGCYLSISVQVPPGGYDWRSDSNNGYPGQSPITDDCCSVDVSFEVPEVNSGQPSETIRVEVNC